ncbi:uncharacterized protein LOC123702390 isoform X2 [Colias croceus]|uniref:uncharacterized protein LOC123702390 isoform X2 n=1 Tax=Colias crocea TaxID=72248 RepID=UPI001E27F7DA|nr:uncharacterized protein LOC123702390 isoform X2 [Colias croceus]
MDSRRSSFFRKFTNMRTVNANSKESSPKPNVVRRLFAKDESDIGSDSEQDSFVTNLRHPRNEEYKILEILPTKDGMMKEAGFSQQGLDLSQFIHPNSSEIEDCTFQEGVSLVQKNYPTQITNSQTRDLERAEIFNHKDYPLETGEHAQKGRSFTQDIHSTQPLFSQTGDLAQAEICIDPNNPLEDHTHKETFFAQDIHSTQASISQTGDLIQAETYLHQDNLIPIQVHAQEEISFVHNIHFTQASISQTCDLIQAETYIHQDNLLPIEDHAQEGTSFVNNIHSKQAPIPFKSHFIQSNTFIEPTINHSLTVISRFDDNLEEEEAGKRKVYEDNQQASTSFGSPSSELCLKQPYKKRRLYEHLKEMDICIQQIRDETASTENLNNATIVINIEPEENKNEYEEEIENINTTINKENVKNNRIYKHIDFLSDSDEFVYSSSTGQDSTESNDTDRVNEKKKRLKKKRLNNFDDTKENSEPKKKERKINKNKVRKQLRNSGKQYVSITGKVVAEKSMKDNLCTPENCHNECYKIGSEKRQAIFNHYWSLSTERRRDWLVGNAKRTTIKRKRIKEDQSRRQYTFDYFINEGEGKRKVCLKFLLNTLDIKQKYLYNIITEAAYGSSKDDLRGKHVPANKTPEIIVEETRNYIKSLPYLPSHYCRKNSKRFYLPQEFRNMSNLYKIYKESMIREDKRLIGERVFQKIFQEYNIGFHIPRKDKCAKCVRFEKEKGEKEEEKLAHLKDKEETYERFQAHQKIQNGNILCVSFDLQKVLNTPYGQSMLLYYSRKLAVYNLTFYESGTREGYCYTWTETEGKRGANEVCTVLEKYIKMVDGRGSIKHLLFYSDACPGQNKNKIVLACIHICLQKCKNITSIQMNYLLPGHTYMPVDSMHSVIEKSVTNTIVWAPSQWPTVFNLARKNPKPYHVNVLTFKDFCGWDIVADKYFKGNLTGKISKVGAYSDI